MNDSDIQWTRSLHTSLKVGGVWTVPRSGLVFRKDTDQTVELITRLAGFDKADQHNDFELIASHFRGAGIEVTDKTKGKK